MLSYKLSFFLHCLSIFWPILIFYFISKLFGQTFVPHLKEYGGDYFPFVLIGLAFSGYLGTALGSFSFNLRREQMIGVLEAILVTPTKISTVIISMGLWNFVFASIIAFVYLLCGVLFFGVNLTNANILGAIVVLTLAIVSFGSIGLISASFIMVFKMGNPVAWVMGRFSSFFGGAYFPITIFPKALRIVSYFLPVTYALKLLRHTLLQGYSLRVLVPEVIMLAGFSILLFPASIFIFKLALRKAKKDGSLLQY